MLVRRNSPQNWTGIVHSADWMSKGIGLLVGHGYMYKWTKCRNEKSRDAPAMQSPMRLIASQGLSRPILWSGRFRIKNNGGVKSWIYIMAVLRGINFSDPVISPENNRDVENRWAAEALFFFYLRASNMPVNGLTSSGALNTDCEMKIIIVYARPLRKYAILYGGLRIWFFGFLRVRFVREFCPFASVLFASDMTRTWLVQRRGKATISGSLVGWNAGNDWILNGGGGNWTKCIKSGQAWQPEMKRSLHYLYHSIPASSWPYPSFVN